MENVLILMQRTANVFTQNSQHMYEINNYITAYHKRNFSSVRMKSEVQQISSQLTLAHLTDAKIGIM